MLVIPSWSKIKTILIAILTIGGSILFGLWKSAQAAKAEQAAKMADASDKAGKRAEDALVQGLQKEQDDAQKPVNTDMSDFYK